MLAFRFNVCFAVWLGLEKMGKDNERYEKIEKGEKRFNKAEKDAERYGKVLLTMPLCKG